VTPARYELDDTVPAAEWDAFVRAQPGWSHCHLAGWRDVMERVFGHECLFLGARGSDGSLAAVLPMVRVRSVVFGHFLVSMPFLNAGGPLGEVEAAQALVRDAVARGRREGVSLLELRGRREEDFGLPVSHRKITVLLDLPATSDALWRRLDSKVRSQVRRPQKEGVEVRFGLDQVDAFFEVFSRHMRDLGTPTQPRALFRTIARVFPEDAWVGVAWLEGRPIAGGFGFRWADEFEMTWASSLREYSRVAPNMLVYWTFMERAIASGARVFDFGRCSPNAGTHRFKRQWGSRDERLWWHQDSPKGRASTPSPDGGVYALGARLWRRLPTSVATAIGPRIVRYIP
jgi:FemAB-related protein (PEP-CTERM system-associated)